MTTDGTGGFINPQGVGGNGAEGPCDFGTVLTFTVEVPPEGVPADPGQICSVVMGPVESNNAARVTLVKQPQGLHSAKGEVAVDPVLLADVVGLPSIEVVSSPYMQLTQMSVSNITPTPTGFSFDADWPAPLNIAAEFDAMMILRTTFDMTCSPTETRQVEAITHVNLCTDDANDDVVWVSSGDECTICGIIAEMAPSPIVPNKGGDEIALGKVIGLRLVIVARIGDSLLLLAENDGGPDLQYDWVASAGEVLEVSSDIVLWTPPAEGAPHLLQVAVHDDDAAAVASYTAVPVRDAGFVA
jgi:hypothetical protein